MLANESSEQNNLKTPRKFRALLAENKLHPLQVANMSSQGSSSDSSSVAIIISSTFSEPTGEQERWMKEQIGAHNTAAVVDSQ
jgi:hypothetical protein